MHKKFYKFQWLKQFFQPEMASETFKMATDEGEDNFIVKVNKSLYNLMSRLFIRKFKLKTSSVERYEVTIILLLLSSSLWSLLL